MLGRILLVEDDPNDVELMQLALQTAGLLPTLDVVADGEQALQYLGIPGEMATQSRSPRFPQLILLDLKLPKLTGLQVLQAIRQNTQTRQLVVVVMSSSQEKADVDSCYSLGINSYIVKPLDYQQFLDTALSISHYWLHLNQPPSLFSA